MSEKKNSFVKRVIIALQGGDEAKIAKFQSDFTKSNNDQIAIRRRELEDIHEKIVDLDEEMEEAVVAVNLEKIKTTESRKAYVNEYRNKLKSIIDKRKELSGRSEIIEEEIEFFKTLNEAIN